MNRTWCGDSRGNEWLLKGELKRMEGLKQHLQARQAGLFIPRQW
jgi:hypothetical protein